mgnify:CR=1 FL=1
MKTINSYDMFDTLFARMDLTPKSIFQQIDSEYKEHNFYYDFVSNRIKAEKDCYNNQKFDIVDVYERMVEKYNLPEQDVEYLLTLEHEIEAENLIPIKENLDKLKPNDIVVSDMYLTQDFLKSFLPKYVNLIVTPSGKADGYIFDELKKKYEIISHTGDNSHSDVAVPEDKGIKSILYTGSDRTDEEEFVYYNNYKTLSNIMRKTRLGSHNQDNTIHELCMLQAEINCPMLILMFYEIQDYCVKNNISNCLLSGRDSEKLHRLSMILSTENIVYKYFFTSRMSRKKSSNDYLEYTKREIDGRKSVIFDLDGTGWSLRNLKMKMEAYDKDTFDNMNLYLFHYLDEANLPGFMERPYSAPDYTIDYTFFTNKFNHNNLELLNLTDHPMVEDVSIIHNNIILDFHDNGHDEDTLKYVKNMDDTFMEFYSNIIQVAPMLIPEIKRISSEERKAVLSFLYTELTKYPSEIFKVLERQQMEEEKAIEAKLKE